MNARLLKRIEAIEDRIKRWQADRETRISKRALARLTDAELDCLSSVESSLPHSQSESDALQAWYAAVEEERRLAASNQN